MSKALHDERLMTVLLGPHVSEKTTVIAEQNNQIAYKARNLFVIIQVHLIL